MKPDSTGDGVPTLRDYLVTAGVLLGGGLLAGCLDDTGGGRTPTRSSGTDEPDGETPAEMPTENETPTDDSSGGSEPYSVSMEPVGEVTFESVPETWVANNGSWADMGVALGLEPPKGVWLTGRYHTQYYDEVPGVSVDESDMVSLYQDGVSKELFYELDADVHVVDPNFLMNRFKGWEQGDVDEIAEGVGPFFGNSIFSTGYPWHEEYRYYTLMEAFEKLSQAFRRTDRYEAFRSLHDQFQQRLDEIVPAAGDRPSVAILWPHPVDEPVSFSPYLIADGTSFKQWRDLQVRDALAETDVEDFHASWGEVDYEMLLSIDPDVLLLRGNEARTADEFRDTVLAHMESDTTASQLTAVENGDVYRGGSLYQGPITNLVLTERAAGQVYGVEEELFDRERVAEIVEGDV